MSDLHEILHDGVPDAPPLIGLAEGAARRGLRRRATRRAGLVAAVCLVAAASFTLSSMLGEDQRADQLPSAQPDDSCRPDAALMEPTDEIVYARFCAPDGPETLAAIVPRVVLTDGAADLAHRFDQMTTQRGPLCLDSTPRYEIQVGGADGSVRQIWRGLCSQDFDELIEAIAAQASSGLPTPLESEQSCVDVMPRGSFAPRLLPADPRGAIADSLGTFSTFSATLCDYSAGGLGGTGDVRELSQAEGERVRVSLLRSFTQETSLCPDPRPLGQPWRVLFLLADGSSHRVDVTPTTCGPTVELDNLLVGTVAQGFLDTVDRLRRTTHVS